MAELKPCPFCGGKIWLFEAMKNADECKIKVYCPRCGMKFSHTQNYAHSASAGIRLCDSFVDVWNRRAEK